MDKSERKSVQVGWDGALLDKRQAYTYAGFLRIYVCR